MPGTAIFSLSDSGGGSSSLSSSSRITGYEDPEECSDEGEKMVCCGENVSGVSRCRSASLNGRVGVSGAGARDLDGDIVERMRKE